MIDVRQLATRSVAVASDFIALVVMGVGATGKGLTVGFGAYRPRGYIKPSFDTHQSHGALTLAPSRSG